MPDAESDARFGQAAATSRHAFWGMDPSGFCGCPECNAPDGGDVR